MAQEGWSEDHVRRLFWRAGFGATPEQAKHWSEQGQQATLKWILDGDGGAELEGPEPTVDGLPLDPVNEWGHDVLWWLDRMVRTRRPLIEKMTLFWHDHFAVSDQSTPAMLAQNRLFRRNALGDFRVLLRGITKDPAMQLFLSLANSDKQAPNENYARELMELFTLGGKGYSERDIREAARALTGFRAYYNDRSLDRIVYERRAHDNGSKRIFGKRGRYDWEDVLSLVVKNRRHAPFMVEKLWNYFITTPISKADRSQLAKAYVKSGYRIKTVLATILTNPALYRELDKPDMVKSPLVYVAGYLRLTEGKVDRPNWEWMLETMGQAPFRPPSVAGWDWGPAWMSTNAMRSRFVFASRVVEDTVANGDTPLDLSPQQALERARDAVGQPWISSKTRDELLELAKNFFKDIDPDSDSLFQKRADMLQRALRHFLISGPDAQLH